MNTVSDSEVWNFIEPEDLWIYDKLILSKKLGYYCGPAGTAPKKQNIYIVRPCVNFRMMGKGSSFMELGPNDEEKVPHGYFWCEVFQGRHLSFDYQYGKQVLAVEGHREEKNRLDRFYGWEKVDDTFSVPSMFSQIIKKYEWLNLEVIGNNIIEAHLRFNDDFRNHEGDYLIPIWNDEFYPSKCHDRIGFIVKKKKS